MKTNREVIFCSQVLVESFVRKYGEKFKDAELLYSLTERGGFDGPPVDDAPATLAKNPALWARIKAMAAKAGQPVTTFLAKHPGITKGKVAIGAAGLTAVGAGLYAAKKSRQNRIPQSQTQEGLDAETAVAFTKYGVKRFAEAQRSSGIDKKIIVKNIVENLRAGMRMMCSSCDEPAKCKAKLASEIARFV